MKTLDEVIAELEDDGLFADALHYLKTYRENQHAYEDGSRKAEEVHARYLEAIKNCEQVENKYKYLIDEYRQTIKGEVEPELLRDDNPVLTWDELRQMEGKPVWVEYNLHLNSKEWQDGSKCWDIVEHFGTIGDDPEEVMFTEKDFVFGKDDLGKTWQAYRKERHD